MRVSLPLAIVFLFFGFTSFGQTNIQVSNSEVHNILTGNYSPSQYQAAQVLDEHDQILCELRNLISPDSLKSYLLDMDRFHTRHTYSDTVSQDSGIGGARRWALQKFKSISSRNENRLRPAYLSFDWLGGSCGDGFGLKNIMGVLPGRDSINKPVIIIEAHLDSRCDQGCDIVCEAKGMEDNASGSALVLELARVMSRYTFDATIVFMLTVGEEQGLLGAHAMAQYCEDNSINLKAVQNNDVIGGVICGTRSSPPSCPVEGDIDSLNVRLFSSAALNGPYRTFARTIKIFYEEKMNGQLRFPMSINVMNSEDRGGRGGDHIPFRERGFRNVRFSSANEHGDGAPDSSYTDRQHTSDDILGVDTDGDLEVDSFYVDFNYLARNTIINGVTATLLALGPETPTFILHDEPTGLRVEITSQTLLSEFRVGVRGISGADFDEVYRFTGTSFVIPNQQANGTYFVSVAGLDDYKIMSPFSTEQRKISDANTPPGTVDDFPYAVNCNLVDLPEYQKSISVLELLDASPNPFTKETVFTVVVKDLSEWEDTYIVVVDNSGKEIKRLTVKAQIGNQKVNYQHRGRAGIHYYSLFRGGVLLDSKKLIIH